MSRRTHHGRRVTAEITIAAPADSVWRAWADPERIAQWFVDRAEGTCRPGEVMTWIFDAFGYRIPVPILEAEPGKTFVTGSPVGIDDGTGVASERPPLMEVELETQGGMTRLRLVNSGFSEDPAADDGFEGVKSGWSMALATLKHWLEHHTDGHRRGRLAFRPVTAGWDRLAAMYVGAAGLREWLDDVEAPPALAVGDRIRASLGGAPISGAVLAHTGREVLLEWSEVGGVLGLKAFPMGPQRVVGLDLSVWRGTTDAVAPAVDRALDRLAAAAG